MVHGNGYLGPFPKPTLSHPSYHHHGPRCMPDDFLHSLDHTLVRMTFQLRWIWLWIWKFYTVQFFKWMGKKKNEGVKSSASIRIRYSIVQNRHPMLIFMLYIHRVWRLSEMKSVTKVDLLEEREKKKFSAQSIGSSSDSIIRDRHQLKWNNHVFKLSLLFLRKGEGRRTFWAAPTTPSAPRTQTSPPSLAPKTKDINTNKLCRSSSTQSSLLY